MFHLYTTTESNDCENEFTGFATQNHKTIRAARVQSISFQGWRNRGPLLAFHYGSPCRLFHVALSQKQRAKVVFYSFSQSNGAILFLTFMIQSRSVPSPSFISNRFPRFWRMNRLVLSCDVAHWVSRLVLIEFFILVVVLWTHGWWLVGKRVDDVWLMGKILRSLFIIKLL